METKESDRSMKTDPEYLDLNENYRKINKHVQYEQQFHRNE